MNKLSVIAYLEFLNIYHQIAETADGHWYWIGFRDKYREPPKGVRRQCKEVDTGHYISPLNIITQVCDFKDTFGKSYCMNPKHLEVIEQVPTYRA